MPYPFRMRFLALPRMVFRGARRLWWLQRGRLLGATSHPLKPLLMACWGSRTARYLWSECELLVIDLEMSSLRVDEGEVLSMGWVEIKQGAIHLSTARHLLLQPLGEVGDSARIHQLRDCELEGGLESEWALQELLLAAHGKILVFHHAGLDVAFLDVLCRRFTGLPLLMPVLDTLQLERDKLLRYQPAVVGGELTLAQCRQRYNLPAVIGHNALSDALATAELLLAHMALRGGNVLPALHG